MFMDTTKNERREVGRAKIIAQFLEKWTSGILFHYLVLVQPVMDTIFTELGLDVAQCECKELSARVGLF